MRRARIRITRELVLFVLGVGGIVHQTVIEHVDRPALLGVFVMCVGLPTYLTVRVKPQPQEDDDS